MKKTLVIAIIFVIVAAMGITVVNAATSSTLGEELYSIGSKYGMQESIKIRIERYLSDYPVSDENANKILELAKEADQIMKDSGTDNYFELPVETKLKLRGLATEAAEIAGATIYFKQNTIDIYKNGKLIDTIIFDRAKVLAYTGEETNTNIIYAGIAVLAVALAVTTVTVARKKKIAANA